MRGVADDGWLGTVREVSPPIAVAVDLSALWPPSRVGSGATPLRVLAYGVDNGAVAEGQLYCWYQLRTGEWIGAVRFSVRSVNGELRRELDQWVIAEALSPLADRA